LLKNREAHGLIKKKQAWRSLADVMPITLVHITKVELRLKLQSSKLTEIKISK